MPTNHSTPELLSESALAEIEARIAKLPEGPWFTAFDPAKECGPHRDSGLALVDTGRESDWPIARLCEWHAARFIAASITDIPALCATLRAAWAQKFVAEDLLHVATESLRKSESMNAALRDQLAQADETNRLTGLQIVELESRLAQVEKERNVLQERLAEEVAKRVNENVEKAERPTPPRTWPKPWWG